MKYFKTTLSLFILFLFINIDFIAAQQVAFDVSAAPHQLMRGPVAFADFDPTSPELEILHGGITESGTNGTFCYEVDNGQWNLLETFAGATSRAKGVIFNLNNDNLPDFAYLSWDGLSVYRNDGGGNFTIVYSDNDGYISSAIVAIDDDNDGDEDLYFTGQKNQNPYPIENGILRNSGGNFQKISAAGTGIPATTNGDVKSEKMDEDNLKDLVVVGSTGASGYGKVLKNNGNGTFTESFNFIGLISSNLTLINVGGNNLPEITVSGDSPTGVFTMLYENLGGMNFSTGKNSSVTNLPNVYRSDIQYGYFNDDNIIDAVIVGTHSNNNPVTQIQFGGTTPFRFDGGNVLLRNVDTSTLYLYEGAIAIADYNQDGFDDILLNGNAGTAPFNDPKTLLYTQKDPLGINENVSRANVQVYPNPTASIVNIEIPEALKIEKIEVYNMLGQVVSDFSNSARSIDLSALQAGVYTIYFHTAKGLIAKKIIKQ